MRAKEVTDLHVLKEGFGLTLSGKALSWFETLNTSVYNDLVSLEIDLIKAFTKIEIKHSVSQLILKFKQDEKEIMREYANCFRQYITRGPEKDLPPPQKLVSIFLEGLLNKSLHANLYGRKHETLNECIKEAIDLDDNGDDIWQG